MVCAYTTLNQNIKKQSTSLTRVYSYIALPRGKRGVFVKETKGGPLVTRRTRRSILQYLHSGTSGVTNNKRLGSNIFNFIIGKHAVRKTKKQETCMKIAKERITLLAKVNDYKGTYSSLKFLRFKKASSGILVRRLSLRNLQN